MPTVKKSTVLISIMCLAAIVWLASLLFRPNGTTSTTTDTIAQAPQKSTVPTLISSTTSNISSPASNPSSAMAPVFAANGMSSTYRPGVGRAIRVTDGLRVKADKLVGWWLYARSAEEASWMDHFGYPTPAEELQLLKMSDEDLATLAKSGDKNAEVHIYARLASAAFTSRDERGVMKSAGFLASLARNNPYGAAKASAVYNDIVDSYYNIPEAARTEEDKKRLQRYTDMYLDAAQTSALFGDHAAASVRNSNGLGPYKDAQVSLSYGETVASKFSQLSRDRIKEGLPPLTILPRPTVPGISDRIYVFDPIKGPVLERY
jgi:hypothetical protein